MPSYRPLGGPSGSSPESRRRTSSPHCVLPQAAAVQVRSGRPRLSQPDYCAVQTSVTVIELFAARAGITTPDGNCIAAASGPPVSVGQVAVPVVTAHVALAQVRPVDAASRNLAPSAASGPVLATTML